ncbi:Steroid 5-alpha-reductase det2 [Datura stramonium]|uniref:Steroid 5-alpha-reductase det2 n=1 Tax=Datura stramonium TaxID=4076 RepID=A0ABS8SER4_DATST|nr:Steroid 5-alpha-reductase det2 [Datura stramonium]
MVVNVWADGVLLGLKSQGGGYKIPRGGDFEYVSCPNYLEQLGWALMTLSWPGWRAELVPRPVSNHKWYVKKFGKDNPKNRKVVFFIFALEFLYLVMIMQRN